MNGAMGAVAEPCHRWPLGQCPYGVRCRHEHHPHLDPGLPLTREHREYMVPNITGDACNRCLQAGRQCDKKGREGDDDPCSECRWFGGESCRCQMAENTSYNDQLWAVMLTRRKAGYLLPPAHSRELGNPQHAAPAPMPDAKVKIGWMGETKEQLLVKPEMLPTFVRELPRAYLCPPRPSSSALKTAIYKGAGSKRKRDEHIDLSLQHAPTTFMAPMALPRFSSPPAFPRPPADPLHGMVVATSWSWDTAVWTHIYASGARVTIPSQSAIPLAACSRRPLPVPQSPMGQQRHSRDADPPARYVVTSRERSSASIGLDHQQDHGQDADPPVRYVVTSRERSRRP